MDTLNQITRLFTSSVVQWRNARILALVLLGCGVTGACSENSNPASAGTVEEPVLDHSRYLDELTDYEAAELCVYTQTLLGGAAEHSCSTDSTATVDTVDECVASNAERHCLVGDTLDCVEAARGICSVRETSACAPYVACAFTATDGSDATD